MEGRWVSIHPSDEALPPTSPRRVSSVARTRLKPPGGREPPPPRGTPGTSRTVPCIGVCGCEERPAMMPSGQGAARLGSGTTMSGFKTHASSCTPSRAQKLRRTLHKQCICPDEGEYLKRQRFFNSATVNYACADHCLTYFRLPYRPVQPGRPAARLQRPADKGYSELTSWTGSRRRPLLLADVGPSM